MKPLIIYFNSDSLQGNQSSSQWSVGAENLFHTLNEILDLRHNTEVIFLDDQLNANCGPKPISTYFGQQKLKHKTKYQRLINRIRKLTSQIDLIYEVQRNKIINNAFTYAHIQETWCFSILNSHKDWSEPYIDATLIEIDISEKCLTSCCSIKNISTNEHIKYWGTDLQDWGKTVAASHLLDQVNGHDVVMYSGPLEHNPPHVHVLHKGSHETLAKYRIEDGILEKGKPILDKVMKDWIRVYRDQLLDSWIRCQQGGHPYKIQRNSTTV